MTEDQILQIKERSQGWERAWWELYMGLMDRLSEATAGSIRGVSWPSENDRDDFVAHLLDGYDRRARSGVLLAEFDPSQGDPVAYLTGREVLRFRAISFLRKKRRPLPKSLRQQGKKLVSLTGHDRASVVMPEQAVSVALLDEIENALRGIILAIPGNAKITRVVEQAGLQLFPRLNWTEPSVQRLRTHLENVLADPSPEWKDRLSMLTSMHGKDRQSIDEQRDQICNRIHNQGRGLSPKLDCMLRDRLDKLHFEAVFLPLSAMSLMRLLGISRADADQRRSRYRVFLPRLLPHLQQFINDESSLGTGDGEDDA